MQRIPITDTPNPNKPYNLEYETICFGKAWNPTNAACKNCKAIHACGTAQFNTNKQKQEDLKDGTPFLSECSFDKVNEDDLLKWVRIFPVSSDEFLRRLEKVSGFRDKVTLTNYLNQFLNRHNLTIEDGIIK